MIDYVPANLGCARCGQCCDPVWMPNEFDPSRIDASTPDNAADKKFIEEHWTRTGESNTTDSSWICDQYDREHGLCTAHENRPPVCRNYPWYGRDPGPGKVFDRQCSYLLDVPPWDRPEGSWPLLPVEVIKR